MDEPAGAFEGWIPIPDSVAALLGRFTYYASWLDDMLGEAVVLGSPNATHLGESTPDWAWSGKRLVSAVRSIPVYPPVSEQLAHRLDVLNESRNLLIHGVWLWKGSSVMVMKRGPGQGERHVEYATFYYDEIEELIRSYQALGALAERFVAILSKHVRRPYEDRYRCPNDATPLDGVVVDERIMQFCPACDFTQSAEPA